MVIDIAGAVRDDVRDQLKHELKHELKQELKQELRRELRRELRVELRQEVRTHIDELRLLNTIRIIVGGTISEMMVGNAERLRIVERSVSLIQELMRGVAAAIDEVSKCSFFIF